MKAISVTALVGLFLAARAIGAPLGHRDFYPSPAQPVGFRGDGSGCFPGATPVTHFWEGTPVRRAIPPAKPGAKPEFYWDFADARPTNIAWKTELPSWGNTQPLVIGDLVVTYGEPDYVFGVDARTGKLRWSRQLNAWAAAGAPAEAAATARELYAIREALYRVIELQFHFGTCGRYLAPEILTPMLRLFLDREWPAIRKALTTLDPAGDYTSAAQKFEDLCAVAVTNHVGDKQAWDYGKKCGVILAALDRRMDALSGVKVPKELPWGNMVGWCMSAPVSDGHHIYAALGQGQTACLDLDGRVIWTAFYPQKSVSTHHVVSPLLASGILIDMHGNDLLRGLDAATGKPLWEASAAIPEKSKKTGYYVAGHRIVNLAGADYLVSSQCRILRVKDGQAVGQLAFGENWHGGAPIAGWSNIVIKCANGDGWSQPYRAFRLSPVADGTVAAELVWESKVPGDYTSILVRPDATLLQNRPGGLVRTITGETLANPQAWAAEYVIGAGQLLVTVPSGSKNQHGSSWSRRRDDGRVLIPFTTVDLTTPEAPVILSNSNLLGGANQPRSPDNEKYLPSLWREPQFFNAKGGRPAHFAHTDTCVMPQGNRLFIRSVSHLYSIGDPAVAYDWNPASRTVTP